MSIPRRPAPVWARSATSPSHAQFKGATAPVPLKRTKASTVIKTKVEFLWFPYIPAGKVTSIEGDPGVGKSWLTYMIAAAVSAGFPLPGQPKVQHTNGNVLIMNGEDGWSDTIVPRLESLGANLNFIDFMEIDVTLNKEGVGRLEAAMTESAATILFIDPIQYFMGAKVDINKANEVRAFMKELANAAERTNCAVIIVRHLRKQGGDNALHKGLGSMDFAASVRSILHVVKGDDKLRFIHHVKANNTEEGRDLAYRIKDGMFMWDLKFAPPKVSTSPKKTIMAKAFLVTMLKNGPLPAAELFQMAADEGISYSALNRAKVGLVDSNRIGDAWYWSMGRPDEPQPAPEMQYASGG